jgi:hypothetical protein
MIYMSDKYPTNEESNNIVMSPGKSAASVLFDTAIIEFRATDRRRRLKREVPLRVRDAGATVKADLRGFLDGVEYASVEFEFGGDPVKLQVENGSWSASATMKVRAGTDIVKIRMSVNPAKSKAKSDGTFSVDSIDLTFVAAA